MQQQEQFEDDYQFKTKQISCILWAGRTKSVGIFEIEDLKTGKVREQAADLGLYHMRDDLIGPELDLPANSDLTPIRTSACQIYMKDSNGILRLKIRIRGSS